MRVAACLFLLAATVLANPVEPAPRIEQPVELILLRDRDQTCNVLALRHTQHIRGLHPGLVHTERLPANNGQERVSFIAEDEELLWSAALQDCAKGLNQTCQGAWGSKNVPEQSIMSSSQELSQCAFDKTPPPLVIKPLIQSGPSTNRVDLVFFSDGCMQHSVNILQ